MITVSEFEDLSPQDHLEMLEGARTFADLSNCRKMRFGAMIISPTRRIIAGGFNQSICQEVCDKECLRQGIASGTRLELCYAKHAEQVAANMALRQLGKTGLDDLICYVNGFNPITGLEYQATGFSCTYCVRQLQDVGVRWIVMPDTTQEHGFRIQTIDEAIETAYQVANRTREAYS